MTILEVETARIVVHPAFADVIQPDTRDVAAAALVGGTVGVAVPVHLRQSATGYFTMMPTDAVTLAGARRAGLATIPACVWREGPVPSALRSAAALLLAGDSIGAALVLCWLSAEYQMTAADISSRSHLPAELVARCLEFGDLPDEARTAVANHRVPWEVAAEVLRVEQGERNAAWRAISAPDFQDGPLNAEQAAEIVKRWFLEPAIARGDWAGHRSALAKAAAEESGLPVELVEPFPADLSGLEEFMQQSVPCHEALPSFYRASKAPQGASWGVVAAAYGVPIVAIPKNAGGGAELRVSRSALAAARDVNPAVKVLNSSFKPR